MDENKYDVFYSLDKNQLKIKTRYQPKREKSKLLIASKIPSKIFKEDIYSCDLCPSLFTKETQLKYHAKSHFVEEEHRCEECHCVFSSKNKLARHKQKVHSEIVSCKFCNANFNHINSLKLHMRLHTGEKPFVCNECGSKFVQSSHLSIHKRSHTGEKPYQCNICKQTFKQISHLRTHERIHTQTKPYSCELCGNSFIQKSSLKRHLRIHTGERPYACEICKAAFCVKNNLTRHMVVHTGDHPYVCDLCNISFTQQIDLKRHKVSHTGIKPFQCDQCEASFSRNSNLKCHKFIHTGEMPFQCDQCDSKFAKPRDLKKHKLTHILKEHTCSICFESFHQESVLNKHMRIHLGENLHSCEECKATFAEKSSLKRHKVKHKSLISVKCSNCYLEFRNNKELEEHRTNHCNSDTEKEIDEIQSSPLQDPLKVDSPKILKTEQLGSYTETDNSKGIVGPYLQTLDYSQHYSTNFINSQDTQQTPMNFPTFVNVASLQALPQAPSIPTLLMPSVGGSSTLRVARLANNCGNHNLHIHILGHNNQVQSWCFCETPNRSMPIENAQTSICFSDSVPQITEAPIISENHPILLPADKLVQSELPLTSLEEMNDHGGLQMYNPNSNNPIQVSSSHQVLIHPQNIDEKVVMNDQIQFLTNSPYSASQCPTLWISNATEV